MSTQSETWLEQSLPFVFQKIEGCATLVSGGAIGVDQHAHKIALRCGANSIAVLPTGLTQTYPASFTELTEAFLDRGGLLVSPFRPTQRVRKSLFASRNFVLVNLVKLLFVVQAEKRSGSYLSAQLAVDSGVEVAALAGVATEAQAAGCLDLIYDGARMIRSAADLNLALGEVGSSVS